MGNCKSKKETQNNCQQARDEKNLTVSERIDSTKAEVGELLTNIDQFRGTTENDNQYRYLDEMLTRCILKLDTIECHNSADRDKRKSVVVGTNKAISILERKLELNSDIKDLENRLKEPR